jgi:hypothetical protein
MNSTLRRSAELIRNHSLLLVPMLGTTVFNSIVFFGIIRHFRDLYFPRIDSHAMRAMKLAARVDGGAAAAAYAVALHNSRARFAIMSGTGIIQIMLDLLAVALTVSLAAQFCRSGSDTLANAIERLRMVPRLFGTLVALALRILMVGTIVVIGLAVLSFIPLMIFYKGHIPAFDSSAASSGVGLLVVSMGALLTIGIVASFVMRYFLDASLQIQGLPLPNAPARKQITRQAVRYAWSLAGAFAFVTLLVGGANVALAGTPVLTNMFLHGIEMLIVSVVQEFPVIVFVVAVSLLVAGGGEQLIESEPVRIPS